jgi:hypothetical protein
MFSRNSSSTACLGNVGLALAIAFTFVAQSFAAPGDLYVSDLASNSVVVYKPDGTSSTFVTGLNSPQGMTFDELGNLYLADGGSGNVFKYATDGTQSIVASGLSDPVGIAILPLPVSGFDLLVSENTGNKVTRVAADGTKSDFAVAVTAPLGVSATKINSTQSDVYVAAASGTIKIAPDGTVTTIYAGSDGRNAVADSNGNVFVSVGVTGEVKKVVPGGNTTIFASGLGDPHGMAFRSKFGSGNPDGVGNLFVADPLGGFIFQITPDGTKTTFASTGKPNYLILQVGETSPTPTPSPSPPPSPSPSASPTISPSPSASPSPTASPSPSVSPTPSPTPGLLRNISTRGQVLTDDNVLIGGFIITGGTAEKTVVVRAIGPSLSALGVPNVMADPVLELHLPDGSVITNNDWIDNSSSDQAALVAAGLAPSDNLESAILMKLPPVDDSVAGSGLYTAIVRGNNTGTGVGLIEVYDMDDSTTTVSQLANISTRGNVGIGDDVLIGGFISGPGSDDGKVLMRAIGPSLTSAGVSGALQNPTLELFDENGDSVAFNDDWQDTAGDEILATGLEPANDSEAAILAAQVAGSYTIIVRGVDNSTGVALVEAYHVPSPPIAR